jgi:hypothetical protein
MHLVESFLKGVKLAISHAFDRCDVGAVGLNSEYRTRLYRLAVYMNGAGAAATGIATNMGACKPEGVAQVMNQQQARFYLVLMVFPIDFNMDFVAHIY